MPNMIILQCSVAHLMVLASEIDREKFKTEDKPWLDCRFTAMLPIKFEIK